MAGGALGAAGALVLLGFGRHASLAVMGAGLALNGLGGGLAIPAVTGAVMGVAPAALAGIASAAFNAGRQVGGVLGVAVLGGLATAGGHAQPAGMHRALVLAALALGAAAALGLGLVGVRSPAVARDAALSGEWTADDPEARAPRASARSTARRPVA